MPKVETIPLTSLMLDMYNPRLEPQPSYRDAILALAKSQGIKLLNLAEDIAKNGLNVSELPIVIRESEESDLFVVVEGNRRVAALKSLANPDILSDVWTPSLIKKLKTLNVTFQENPIQELACGVYANRDEADRWVEIRHSGEHDGVGIVPWGGTERERFRARKGAKSPQLEILDYVKSKGNLSEIAKAGLSNFAITNVQRLIEDAYVRKKLGISIEDGQVITNFEDDQILKGLTKIVEDVSTKAIKVGDIETRSDRAKYIDSFGQDILPSNPSSLSKRKITTNEELKDKSQVSQSTPRRTKPANQQRKTLIPSDCKLLISNPKVNSVYYELKKLKVEEFSCAAGVLMRVFIELSADCYITEKPIVLGKPLKDVTLKAKLEAIAKYWNQSNIMTDQQLSPIYRAAQPSGLFAGAIHSMNQYVHNPFFSASPIDLKIGWDDLQPFFEEIWK
jgi:hypothetical protein